MKSFFEKLTGNVNMEDGLDIAGELPEEESKKIEVDSSKEELSAEERSWIKEESEEGELTVDMYQDPDNIIIKTIVAGVKPEDLDISITRDMVTIKGKREEAHIVSEEDYFSKELYWGSFSRTVTLPVEIDTEEAEALEQHGMLTLKLPKIDKGRKTKLKVKSHR